MPGGPTGGGGMNVDEKLAILIKSYELEPLPKLALEVGEKATVDLLHSGQYLGHLIRDMNLEFIGYDRVVTLLDRATAMLVRDDPVSGFSHYLVDHGVARVFGRELHEGKVPLEPAIGAASAIGIVEKDMDGTTKVFTKKQLGLKNEPLREIAKKFYRPGGVEENEYSRAKDIEHETQVQKEPFEYIKEEMEKKKRQEESEIEPTWVAEEEIKEIQDEEEREERREIPGMDDNEPREIDIHANPDIVPIDQENELMYPSWVDEKQLKLNELRERERIELKRRVMGNDYALQQMIEEDEYILPFDFKKEGEEEAEGDRNESKKEEDDGYLVPF